MADGTQTAPADANGAAAPATPERPRVRFDTTDLKSSYCNVCNGSSTREEVVVNFGVNENWELNQPELQVKLLHRIVLSPHAALRLQEMMTKLLKEHEERYGPIGKR